VTEHLTHQELPDFLIWCANTGKLKQLAAFLPPKPLWAPYQGKPQEAAYHSKADILGFGGAAGGGKTDLLLGLALTAHRRSVIFRREASQGRGLLDRAQELLGGIGRLNENTGVYRGIPGGRQIEFAGVKDLGDEQKHKGRPHDFVGFDEGDQFLESQVRFLLGWLRTTIRGQRCRCVICFNPPTSAEGRWLLSYFAPWISRKHPNPARPGELRWYAMLPNGTETERPNGEPFEYEKEIIVPRSRTFIPPRAQDNPALMQTGYLPTLQALPEPLRSQLLLGDFQIGIRDDPWQTVPTAWVEAAQQRWRDTTRPTELITALGVDVARGGTDKTVLSKRYWNWFAQLDKYPGSFTPNGPLVAQLVFNAMETERLPGNWDTSVHVDVIGVGASVYDACVGLGMEVRAINFGEGTDAHDRSRKLGFANKRALYYWRLREALDPQTGDELCLPPDSELLADLTAPRWSLQSGRIKIESKEDIQKRIGRSTDCGDAVVLANIESQVPSEMDLPYCIPRAPGWRGYR